MILKLLSAKEVAEQVGKTKQWVHWAYKAGEFPEPFAEIGTVKGWMPQQVEEWKKKNSTD